MITIEKMILTSGFPRLESLSCFLEDRTILYREITPQQLGEIAGELNGALGPLGTLEDRCADWREALSLATPTWLEMAIDLLPSSRCPDGYDEDISNFLAMWATINPQLILPRVVPLLEDASTRLAALSIFDNCHSTLGSLYMTFDDSPVPGTEALILHCLHPWCEKVGMLSDKEAALLVSAIGYCQDQEKKAAGEFLNFLSETLPEDFREARRELSAWLLDFHQAKATE